MKLARGGFIVLLGCAFAAWAFARHSQTHVDAPPPHRLPPQLAGEWIQVWPRNGALDRFIFDMDSTFHMSGAIGPFLIDGERFEPDRWYVDTLMVLGHLCVTERPRTKISRCTYSQVRGDTLRIQGWDEWFTLLRVKDGIPVPTRPWTRSHMPGVIEVSGNSLAPLTPIVVR